MLWLCFFCLGFLSCEKDRPAPSVQGSPFALEIPEGFPSVHIPADNQLTIKRVALGKKLFYDPILSRDSTISCATCHLQQKAFTDGLAVSIGIDNRVGFRNVPILSNLGYHPYFFREGGGISLETQVIGPIESVDEMGFNMAEAGLRLSKNQNYQALAREAYDREADAFVISRALAAFERTLLSGNSTYDQITRGDLVADAAFNRGQVIFQESGCDHCHSGFDFSNYDFENNGLYEQYDDIGRKRVSGLAEDEGKFKIPSLRNVELTAPYMHDGSVPSMEAVVQHYNNGGSNHPNKSALIRPLGLSELEMQDLVVFLKSLTDKEFVSNPDFTP